MTTLTINTYGQCLCALIVASLTNRKHFDLIRLQELADNIKARQVDQPIIIRMLPGHRMAETFDAHTGAYVGTSAPKPIYEIVAGERRWRASVLAGLTHIPVILREYTDAQAIEVQMCENIWRETLTGLEEGEGFEQWLEQPGITTTYIAEKSGKSLRYVQSRLQLLKLQPETKAALRTGDIEVSQALLLAPVHDPKLQLKALDYASTAPTGGTKPSVRELQVWLQQNVMLALDRAPFPITVKNLVPKVGACKPACPKRTGASPDIFEYVLSADTCTDLICWKAKEDAHLAALQIKANGFGMRLVHGAEAKAICYPKSSALKGYSPLSQVRNDLASGLQGQRLDAVLGHSATTPLPNAVLIENPFTRELITAVPTEEAEAALLAKGLLKAMPEADEKADKAKSKKDVDVDIAKLKSNVDFYINKRFAELARAAVVENIMSKDNAAAHQLLTVELLRAFVYESVHHGTGTDALEDSGLLAYDDFDDLTDTEVLQAAALIMTAGPTETQQAYAVENGIDTRALVEQATEQIRAEVAEQIAVLKAAQKTPPPKSPLAQPSAAPVADAENPKPKAGQNSQSAKAQAKAKLSAKDAQLGIAEAMQGIEAPPADGAALSFNHVLVYVKGQQVKVKAIREDHEYWRVKYVGKTGKVDAIHKNADDEDLYVVTFKGRTGGVADFTADELEAVAA